MTDLHFSPMPHRSTAPRPLRLPPGVDVRRELERLVGAGHVPPGFVIAGVGSVADAIVRFAGQAAERRWPGPHELLTLSGSLSVNGAHLHASFANGEGRVVGGHMAYGNEVRTTVELLLLDTPDWALRREWDETTGYPELVVTHSPRSAGRGTD